MTLSTISFSMLLLVMGQILEHAYFTIKGQPFYFWGRDMKKISETKKSDYFFFGMIKSEILQILAKFLIDKYRVILFNSLYLSGKLFFSVLLVEENRVQKYTKRKQQTCCKSLTNLIYHLMLYCDRVHPKYECDSNPQL